MKKIKNFMEFIGTSAAEIMYIFAVFVIYSTPILLLLTLVLIPVSIVFTIIKLLIG